MSEFLEQSFFIRSSDTDLNAHLRPSALLSLCQDAADSHAALQQCDRRCLVRDYGAVWLLTRMYFHLDRPLYAGETLTIRTWQRPAEKLMVYRDYDFLHEGELVGEGVSAWVIAGEQDRKMMRPTDIPAIVQADRPAQVKSLRLKPIRRPAQPETVYTRTVRWSDLDVNGHMNNAKYTYALFDSFSSRELKEDPVTMLEVIFKNQTREGDTLKFFRRFNPDGSTDIRADNQSGTAIYARLERQKQ